MISITNNFSVEIDNKPIILIKYNVLSILLTFTFYECIFSYIINIIFLILIKYWFKNKISIFYLSIKFNNYI